MGRISELGVVVVVVVVVDLWGNGMMDLRLTCSSTRTHVFVNPS